MLSTIKSAARRFKGDESGATAIEYSLIAASVGVAAVTVLTTLGTAVVGKLQEAADALQ